MHGADADCTVIPAKLAISIARKMNALIFLVPEDIVDVRPRLVSLSSCLSCIPRENSIDGFTILQIMTFVGSLMALEKQQ